MLIVQGMSVHRAGRAVLEGVSFQVAPGELVALLGRNGSGRTTLLEALMGLLPWHGQVCWRGGSLAGQAPHAVARLGVGHVPEGRGLFSDLSVEDNLRLGERPGRGQRALGLAGAWALFPQLRERRRVAAGLLSGGEQQMLALARALVPGPELLLIDEPTEGLSPQAAQAVIQTLQGLKAQGVAMLVAEQKTAVALHCADRALVLRQGHVAFDGPPRDAGPLPPDVEGLAGSDAASAP
jgi:branched-chain amino acid transport system ATP-binding protein